MALISATYHAVADACITDMHSYILSCNIGRYTAGAGETCAGSLGAMTQVLPMNFVIAGQEDGPAGLYNAYVHVPRDPVPLTKFFLLHSRLKKQKGGFLTSDIKWNFSKVCAGTGGSF